MSTTISKAENLVELIERLPPDGALTQHGFTWDEYEELLHVLGDSRGRRVSYNDGTLQIERLVGALSLRLRIRVLSYGSSTIKKRREQKGVEPDACFYVQNATLVGTKEEIDFNVDPPPDVAVEIDLHHGSLSKFPIYAAHGVPEIWRYDGDSLTIYHLRDEQYVPTEASLALPLLTSTILTEFLARSPKQDQYDILLAFEEWLKLQQP
jgi:Uma2 family endonuclease